MGGHLCSPSLISPTSLWRQSDWEVLFGTWFASGMCHFQNLGLSVCLSAFPPVLESQKAKTACREPCLVGHLSSSSPKSAIYLTEPNQELFVICFCFQNLQLCQTVKSQGCQPIWLRFLPCSFNLLINL